MVRVIPTTATKSVGRRFFVLGACGFLAITVIQVPIVADHWRQLSSQHARRQQSLTEQEGGNRAAEWDEQLSQVRQQLADYERSMVGGERMPAIQSELMDLARASGCQLRKAVAQAGTAETWEPEQPAGSDEDMEAEPVEPARLGMGHAESPYRLNTEQLSLSLTGTLSQTLDFLDRVQQRTWLMRVAQINFSRDADGGGMLIVEANLAFYKLIHQNNTNVESKPWREGSRTGRIQ